MNFDLEYFGKPNRGWSGNVTEQEAPRDFEGELEPAIDMRRVFDGLVHVWHMRLGYFLDGKHIDAQDLERLGIQIAAVVSTIQEGR